MNKLLLIVFFGLALRLLLVPLPGFEGDIIFWKSWSQTAAEKGIVYLTENTDYNYPAGFSYILWLIGKTYKALNKTAEDFWRPNNYQFLFLSKLPSILADLGIFLIIYSLFLKPELLGFPLNFKKYALLFASFYFLNPVALFDGALWGQVDSFGILFLFLTIFFLTQKRPCLATACLSLGFLLKLQNIIFLPLYFFYLWRVYGWKEMIKNGGISLFIFLIITPPFMFANNSGRPITLIFQNADWFPFLSLHAYNLWWILSLGKGMTTSDKILTFGLTSAKNLGLILFASAYLLSLGFIFNKPSIKKLIFVFYFIALSFFVLPTQSHERYIFPAFSLLPLLLPFFANLIANQKSKIYKIGFLNFNSEALTFALCGLSFIIFSFFVLINLNNSLISFYPKNGISFLKIFGEGEKFDLSFVISALNFLLFLILVFFLSQKTPRLFAAAFLFIPAALIINNLDFLFKNQISLTKLKPIEIKQEYGILQVNQSLNSMLGAKNKFFLSSNYYFYRRGFGAHANSEIVFDIDKKFKKFATDFGIDSEAGEKASVIFEIYGDGKTLFKSPLFRKFDLPGRTEISIEGVKTLKLVINDGGDGITDDHADWLEPILYK